MLHHKMIKRNVVAGPMASPKPRKCTTNNIFTDWERGNFIPNGIREFIRGTVSRKYVSSKVFPRKICKTKSIPVAAPISIHGLKFTLVRSSYCNKYTKCHAYLIVRHRYKGI